MWCLLNLFGSVRAMEISSIKFFAYWYQNIVLNARPNINMDIRILYDMRDKDHLFVYFRIFRFFYSINAYLFIKLK